MFSDLDPTCHVKADPDPTYQVMSDRNRIRIVKKFRIRADPDPKHCWENFHISFPRKLGHRYLVHLDPDQATTVPECRADSILI